MRTDPEFTSMTNVNGLIRETTSAHIPVLDRGFLYGDSIYEVFRTYDGVPLFYDEHWARFENSAEMIHLQIGLTKEQMAEEIKQTVHASGAQTVNRDVYVRYIVTRGEGALDLHPEADLSTSYVIIVRAVPEWNPELYTQGAALAVARTRRNPRHALDPNIKGGNYLNNVLGVIEARALGADDCLMLNDADLITEASNSNVFFVLDGELVTPSQQAANLRGLTKAAVHAACGLHGLPTKETEISVESLQKATECFLTSATREVMPVRSLRVDAQQSYEFPEGGGPVTRRVSGYYRDYVADYIAAHRILSVF